MLLNSVSPNVDFFSDIVAFQLSGKLFVVVSEDSQLAWIIMGRFPFMYYVMCKMRFSRHCHIGLI